jgi:hypothetical protein
VLSDEHIAYAWMTVGDYAERYCDAAGVITGPAWVVAFLGEMRTNCELFKTWLRGTKSL